MVVSVRLWLLVEKQMMFHLALQTRLLPLKESLACPVGLACQQSQAHELLSGECPIEDVVLHVFSIACAHLLIDS